MQHPSQVGSLPSSFIRFCSLLLLNTLRKVFEAENNRQVQL